MHKGDYALNETVVLLFFGPVYPGTTVAWKIVPLRHLFPLKVVPLIEVLL
jgi:hypothetical protein